MPPTAELEALYLALHRRCYGRFLGFAERLLDKDDAVDAVADAMAILWERWATLDPDDRIDNFAFGIVRNRVRATLRKVIPLVALEDVELELEQISAVADAEAIQIREDAARDERIAALRDRILSTMPHKRREVLLVILENSMSYRVAAEALGVNKGTISRHMKYALQTFRAAFTNAGLRLVKAELKRLPIRTGVAAND